MHSSSSFNARTSRSASMKQFEANSHKSVFLFQFQSLFSFYLCPSVHQLAFVVKANLDLYIYSKCDIHTSNGRVTFVDRFELHSFVLRFIFVFHYYHLSDLIWIYIWQKTNIVTKPINFILFLLQLIKLSYF